MNQPRVIAIDDGNRNIKTQGYTFPAGFMDSEHLPSLGGDTIVYQDKEYTLVDERMPQKNDKTTDDSYIILTLAGIAKELCSDMDALSCITQKECLDVVLLTGLPPSHYKEMASRYAAYYKGSGERIDFVFNSIPFSVRIKDVYVYPQAFAAALTIRDKVKESKIVNIVDFGGYTVDLLQLTDFKPDMKVCTSLYGGVNTLFERINEVSRSKGKQNIPDVIIEGILLREQATLHDASTERVELVQSHASKFAREILLKVSQAGLDLVEHRTVFVGGGSILLREHIENTGLITKPIFVDNVRANVEGYQLLYENRKAVRPQRDS